jgi:two-component system sensor histidine kinase TctE
MTAQTDNRASIRRRLIVTLFLPAAVVLTAGTVSDYLTALPPLTDAFDQALLESALAIAAHVQPDSDGRLALHLPPDALAVLRAHSKDSIYFRVGTRDGALVAGDVDLPMPPASAANPRRGYAQYRGEPVRLVAYKTYASNQELTVTMGETLNKRTALSERILGSALATDGLVLGIILLLIWISVRLSLQPLRAMEEEISKRSAQDLTPVAAGDTPAEVRGLVAALNRLFGTVRDNAARQRQFLDNAAHQLRTPLAGIQAQVELLSRDEPDAARRERLHRVLDAARRVGRTAQQLLLLARADQSASSGWLREDVDLVAIVESTVGDQLAAAEAAGIDFGADLAEAPGHGVDWLLSEAARTLTENAIAHTPAGGRVTVRCGEREGRAFLEVEDTGVGIPAAERERVLERFYRASNTRGAGSGLGLAIVKEVAELHGADLSIEPGADGVGTRVTITLPRQRCVSLTTHAAATHPTVARIPR